MKKSILIMLAAINLCVYTSCEKVVGEGPVVSQVRNVSNFREVSVSISGKVNYTIDPVYKVEVLAQQNVLDVLQTNIVGNQLVIKIKDGVRVKNNTDITVNVHAPYADYINLSGSAEFNMQGVLTAVNSEIHISGSGNITIPQAAVSSLLKATISGSGNIYLQNGTAQTEDLRISGSGNMDMANVTAQTTNAEISGSGDMRVKVSQQLNASISGSGSVLYRGTPVVSAHISGSGKVLPF